MVFEDPSRKRWRLTIAAFVLIVTTGSVIFGLSYAAVIKNPFLPALNAAHDGGRNAIQVEQILAQSNPENNPTAFRWEHSGSSHDEKFVSAIKSVRPLAFNKNDSRAALNAAFLLQEDAYSIQSFTDNSNNVDMVFPDWFYLTEGSCAIDTRENASVTKTLIDARVTIAPVLTNAKNGVVYAKEFSAIIRDQKLSNCLAESLADSLKARGAHALNVDIETITGEDDDFFVRFLYTLTTALHQKDLRLVVTMPAGNQAYHPQHIASIADAVVVMLHGQHYGTSKPGPLASERWFASTLNYYSSVIPANKLILGLGSYGYDWTLGSKERAKDLTYADIMALAIETHATPEMDPASRNMIFGYIDENKKKHAVWFLDALSIWNEWNLSRKNPVLGYGVWRLGSEDPNIWTYLGTKNPPSTVTLTMLPALRSVSSSGDPEIYRFKQTPQSGQADITLDASGNIARASYASLPSGYLLERAGNAVAKKTVVLTFNDAPNPDWMPQIMQTLKQYDAPATFFIRGDLAERYPDLIKSIADNGFTVGNQGTVYEAEQTIRPERVKAEANTTQRIIENTYKRRTTLFRIPYTSSVRTNSLEEMDMVRQIASLGYIFVRPTVYARTGNDSSQAIVSDITNQLADDRFHIITFDQSSAKDVATLTATVHTLIQTLQKEGYTIADLPDAINIATSDILPSFTRSDSVLASATGIVSNVRINIWPVIFWVFLFTTIFSFVRLVFMIVFVSRSLARARRYLPTRRKVSILVPAYNEEKTIAKTLASLQESSHRYFEVLVIDDGSTDRTADIVKLFAESDSRIRLIRKENGGKASALNLGLESARYSVIITIDADTILMEHTVRELTKPFADPNIDAVCGNVEVGNIKNMLTGFQALEYITAQNFDRRAFDELNAISVVPGATGAWRRDKIMAIGGYHDDTLAEDADLTLRLLAAGGKIVYAPAARSQTEAPEDIATLTKQRFRWAFGTFQCLGKHHKLFFKKRVGWVALPNIFIFQIVFPLLAPLGDIAFIICLVKGQFMTLVYSYIAFTIFDVIGSIFAFRIDKKPYRLIGFALIQRFFYRQFMYLIIIRTIIATLRGQKYAWNKLDRTGSVNTTRTIAPQTP